MNPPEIRDQVIPSQVLGVPVSVGTVPDHLPDALEDCGWMQAAEGRVLFRVDGAGRLLVEGDRSITVQLEPDAPANVVDYLLYGWATKAVLLARGVFSLHGSSVALPSGGVVVTGRSGAGKSTTSVALARRGGRLVIDDVSPVELGPAGARVLPFVRPVHLVDDAAEAAGLDLTSGRVLHARQSKRAYDLPTHADDPMDLDLFIHLLPRPRATRVELVPLHGARRLAVLKQVSDKVGLSSAGSRRTSYFDWATRFTTTVPMAQIVRPPDADTLAEVLDLIEGLLAEPDRLTNPRSATR